MNNFVVYLVGFTTVLTLANFFEIRSIRKKLRDRGLL